MSSDRRIKLKHTGMGMTEEPLLGIDRTNIVVDGIPVEVIVADHGYDVMEEVYRWNQTRFFMLATFSITGKGYEICQSYDDAQDRHKALDCVRDAVRLKIAKSVA